MPTTLIRGRYVVVRAAEGGGGEVLEDAAVVERDGVIQDVGPYESLRARHPVDPVVGSPGNQATTIGWGRYDA